MHPGPPPANSSPRLRLRVSPVAETLLRSGHPWLFADSVRGQNREGQPGEFAVVYDRNDAFLAIGLYDPGSPIRLRVLHHGKPATLDDAWWTQRLAASLTRRATLFDDRTDGYRWVNGESDGWPGLVLDRYAKSVVIKLYTAAWFPHLDRLTRLIQDQINPARLVLRLSRNIQDAANAFGLAEGQALIGTAPEKAGVLSFVIDGYRTEDIGAALAREGIAVRAGHHCAQPILRRFGLESTVRPSLAFYNTCEELDALGAALWSLTSGGLR